MQIREKHIMAINMAYCYLPVLLFMGIWVKPLIGVLAILGICAALYYFFRDMNEKNEAQTLQLSKVSLSVIICVLFAICIFAGMGNWWPQVFDYEKHNAVLQDLVRFEWPVMYTQYDTALLTYYIGQYLFPALVGKLFGSLRVADYMMGVMGVIGVILVLINILFVTKAETDKKRILVLVLFLLFSGMLYPLQLVLNFLFPESNVLTEGSLSALSFSGGSFEYRPIFTCIQWVHQQAIIPWLCLLMFFKNRDNYKYYALMVLPAFPSGTWGFVGIVMMASLYIVANLILTKGTIWKEVLSWQNVLIILVPGIIITFYFLGNVLGDKPDGMGFGIGLRFFWFRALFCLFMFGFYICLIAKSYYKDPLFWAMAIVLTFIPFTSHSDFIMGTSMPALLLLLIYIIRFLFYTDKTLICKVLLVLCLLIGARNSILLIKEAATQEVYDHFKETSLVECTNRENPAITKEMKYQYYTYNPESTIFYKYLMRK